MTKQWFKGQMCVRGAFTLGVLELLPQLGQSVVGPRQVHLVDHQHGRFAQQLRLVQLQLLREEEDDDDEGR